MTSSKPKLANLICLRLDENTLTAIRKSGQNTSDWFRGAARNRIDGERQADTPTGKLEKQIEGLQKEVARLQQADAIAQAAQAETRKVLVTIQGNQAEL